MLCMYLVYYLVQVSRLAVWLGALASIALGALLGIGVHLLIITPILGSAPINQLLATGGLLFFLQSFATFLWTTDHKSVRMSLPSFEVGGIFVPLTRLIPFAISIVALIGLYLFPHPHVRRHRHPRGVAGPRGDVADGRQPAAHLHRHLGGGRPDGRPGRRRC